MSHITRPKSDPCPQPDDELPHAPSPFVYPGGKSNAAPVIVPLIMEGLKLANTNELVSPFIGGGNLEITCALLGAQVFGSDAFGPLVNCWKHLLGNPAGLANEVRKYQAANVNDNDNHFKELQELVPRMPDGLQKAAAFYVINKLSFRGSTFSGGRWTWKRITPGSIKKLKDFSAPSLSVALLDYHNALSQHPFAFAYLDPPYEFALPSRNCLYGVNGDMHRNFDHEGLFNAVRGRSNWIMSYNADEHVLDRYAGFPMAFPTWQYGMSKTGESNEVLIFSKDRADLAEMARALISVRNTAKGHAPANDNAPTLAGNVSTRASDKAPLVVNTMWEAPDLSVLFETATPPPPFPKSVLGDEWCRWCEDVAASANAPLDYVAMSLMTAAAGLIGNSLTVRANNGFVQVPTLWMCCVGKSGSGKTSALNVISDIVDALESQSTERQRLRQVSVAAAVKLASENPKGLILFRDELSGLWTVIKKSEGEDFWLEAYNGKPFSKDRENRDPIYIEKLSISVIGGAQPGTIKDVTTDRKSRGFSSRYIFGYPDPVTNYNGEDVEIDTDWATAALGRLKELPVASASIPLSDDGLVIFRDWWNAKIKTAADHDGLWAEWLLKQGGNVLRLALCLEMLKWSTTEQDGLPHQVATSTLKGAITLIDAWAIPMAQRTLEVMHRPSTDQHAAALSRHLRRVKLAHFNARRVRRGEYGPVGILGDARVMEEACQALVNANLIRHVGVRNHLRRGRASQDYEVNPVLFASGIEGRNEFETGT